MSPTTFFATLFFILLVTHSYRATQLHCDDFGSNQYFSIESVVDPFFADEDPTKVRENATRINANILLSCDNPQVTIDGKQLQEWRLELMSLYMKQPCPQGDGWEQCTEDSECQDTWRQGTNVAYFLIETYPDAGSVYWDPSEEGKYGETEEACFAKYSVLQQLQGALKNDTPPHKSVHQQSIVEDGRLINSTRLEHTDDQDGVRVPGIKAKALIQLRKSSREEILASQAMEVEGCTDSQHLKSTKKKTRSNNGWAPILSDAALCPQITMHMNSVRREMSDCHMLPQWIEEYWKESGDVQRLYTSCSHCLMAEDRPAIQQEHIQQLVRAFKEAKSMQHPKMMRDFISLMVLIPSNNAVHQACLLIETMLDDVSNHSRKLAIAFTQMVTMSPNLESKHCTQSHGCSPPEALMSLLTRFAGQNKDTLLRMNALLMLSTIARRSGMRHHLINVDELKQLPLAVQMDILKNGGDAYTNSEFLQIASQCNVRLDNHVRMLKAASVLRSNGNIWFEALLRYDNAPSIRNRLTMEDLHWNVTVPTVSKSLGSEYVIGVDYLHEAYTGVDYESCEYHDVKRFRYAAKVNTHLNIYFFSRTYKLWDVIVDEVGATDTKERSDYIRIVWRNHTYYDDPLMDIDCRTFDKDLYSTRFNYPTAYAMFQIGPVPMEIALYGNALIDVKFHGEFCPLQVYLYGSIDPSMHNTFTGSSCVSFYLVKACADVTGGFTTHLQPGFNATLSHCPHGGVCAQADLRFTDSDVSVNGQVSIRKVWGGWKSYRSRFFYRSFSDYTRPLVEERCWDF